jgi:hypothetical protein
VKTFVPVGNGSSDYHHSLGAGVILKASLTDGALRVGIVVAQLRFFNSYRYVTYPRCLVSGIVHDFVVVLSLWS